METKELEKEFLMMIEAQKRTIYKVCYIYANDQDDLNDLYQETVLNQPVEEFPPLSGR